VEVRAGAAAEVLAPIAAVQIDRVVRRERTLRQATQGNVAISTFEKFAAEPGLGNGRF
jgi:hypothetical protein